MIAGIPGVVERGGNEQSRHEVDHSSRNIITKKTAVSVFSLWGYLCRKLD